MDVLRTKEELKNWLSERAAVGRGDGDLGFVPTMGALHVGHRALVNCSSSKGSDTIVSIFVNPRQFNEESDFASYPQCEVEDIELCREWGVDAVFIPECGGFYAEDHSIEIRENNLSLGLCGESRPGHFDGVCLVLVKMLNLIRPGQIFMGEKDFQQVAVVKRLVRDLEIPVEVVAVPTERETDGLAISSRNCLLRDGERAEAVGIYRALLVGLELFVRGERRSRALLAAVRGQLEGMDGELDYLELVDAESLKAIEMAKEGSVIAVAFKMGGVRLIDNLILRVDS